MKKIWIHIIPVLLACIITSGIIMDITYYPSKDTAYTYQVLPDKTEN